MKTANAPGRMRDRRRIDREESPPGAATEAAIARTIELDGLPPAVAQAVESSEHARTRLDHSLLMLSVAAAGVVFGDIGTNPLFAAREAFRGPHGISPTPADILGVLSLIVWSLLLVVTVK